jgi:hypothetical protein
MAKAKKLSRPKLNKKAKENTMDRMALKAVVSQLQAAGVEIKVLKSDSDDQLHAKVNDALQQLPPPAVLKTLHEIVPDKLVAVLKRKCLGIFIDLTDISCKKCGSSEACAKEFIKNIGGGMKEFDKALLVEPVTRYERKRAVFVRDVKNPNPPGDDLHDTIQAILEEQPETLKQLRVIVERDFSINNDEDFMALVTALRHPEEGVIKLDLDLSEKNKIALRKAGHEI